MLDTNDARSTILNSNAINQWHVIEALPMGVVLLDSCGKISYLNKAAHHMLERAIIGKPWIEIISSSFAPQEDDGHEISLLDGRKVNVALSSLSPCPGEMITLTDLTQTRNYEASKNRQERLSEMGEMTAHLAHQIRTPLASATLYLNNMENPRLANEKKQEYVTKIKQAMRRIEQQVNDLLIFAKGGESILQETKSQSFIARINQTFHEFSNESGFTFVTNVPQKDVIFRAHLESLQGALENLINNAVNANATSIELIFNYDSTESKLFFAVKDNGDGMSDSILKKVKNPFFTTKAKGTGLGLAIADAVAKTHGGEVNIQSIKEVGTTITITIPWIK